MMANDVHDIFHDAKDHLVVVFLPKTTQTLLEGVSETVERNP